MKFALLKLLIFISVISSCDLASPSKSPLNDLLIENKINSFEIVIDLEEIDTLILPELVEVIIEKDHVFKTSKKYLAYPLKPILNYFLSKNTLDSLTTEVEFVCKDGYTPSNAIIDLFSNEGFLAIKDIDSGKDKFWPDSVRQKFSPFYLVWKNIPYGDNKIAWPYGLTKIKLVNQGTIFKDIYPYDDSSATFGFYLFKQHCLKCHSINKIGGNLGPELNYPKNILEYWSKEDIKKFTKNPSSYRYNSTMPALTELKNDQLEQIIDYLTYMSNNKIN